MKRPSKARLSQDLVVPIVGDGGIAGPVAEGRLVPVLILDTQQRPEVAELIRVHEHLPPGDVTSQWAGIADDEDQLALILQFDRPLDVQLVLLFSIERQALLVESVMAARAVYLTSGKPGDRVIERLDDPRILVEVTAAEYEEYWDKALLKRMTRVMATRLGVSKRKARPDAERLVATIRALSQQRLTRHDGSSQQQDAGGGQASSGPGRDRDRGSGGKFA